MGAGADCAIDCWQGMHQSVFGPRLARYTACLIQSAGNCPGRYATKGYIQAQLAGTAPPSSFFLPGLPTWLSSARGLTCVCTMLQAPPPPPPPSPVSQPLVSMRGSICLEDWQKARGNFTGEEICALLCLLLSARVPPGGHCISLSSRAEVESLHTLVYCLYWSVIKCVKYTERALQSRDLHDAFILVPIVAT